MSNNQPNAIFSKILSASLALNNQTKDEEGSYCNSYGFCQIGNVFEAFAKDNDVNDYLKYLEDSNKTVISLTLDNSNSKALSFSLLYAEKIIVRLPRLNFYNHWDCDEGRDYVIDWTGFEEYSSFCLEHKSLIEDGLLLPIPSFVSYFDGNSQREFLSDPEQCTRKVSDLTLSDKEVTRPIDSLRTASLPSLLFPSIRTSSQEPYEYILELREKHKKTFDLYTRTIKKIYQSSSERDAISKLEEIDEGAQEISAIVSKYARDRRFKEADVAFNLLTALALLPVNSPYAHALSIGFSGRNVGSRLLEIIRMNLEHKETVKRSPFYYAYASHKHLASYK